MFCFKCGKEIDENAVVCIHCGVETKNMQKQSQQGQPVVINNSSSASAASAAASGGGRRYYSPFFDFFMICITGGLWIIWMIIRPKYY